jgi:hypothetical protein
VAADVLYVSAMKQEEETIHCSKERREGVGCVEADRRWWRRAAVAADVLYVSAMKKEEETIADVYSLYA